MKEHQAFFDSFSPFLPNLNAEAFRHEYLNNHRSSEPVPLQAGLLVMVNKAVDLTRLLPKCIISGAKDRMGMSESAVQEIQCQEKVLTAGLVSSNINRQSVKGVIELPGSLERIGHMLEGILTCCRIKAQGGIPFSERAHAELDQLFAFLLDMMLNLRDEFEAPNEVLPEQIVFCGNKMSHALLSFRFAHWVRLKTGFCEPHASSIYLDLLDSMTAINEYLRKICVTLLELGTAYWVDAAAPGQEA
jgi:Na+/phosphate symporter